MYVQDESRNITPKTAGDLKNWARHKKRCRKCIECSLSVIRKYICLYRGAIPADILFVGLAPGKSDDLSGLPFSEPKQRSLLSELVGQYCVPCNITTGYTNILGCYCPPSSSSARINKYTDACTYRFSNALHMAKPQVIIVLGSNAVQPVNTILPQYRPSTPVLITHHPSQILSIIDPIKAKAARNELNKRVQMAVKLVFESRG